MTEQLSEISNQAIALPADDRLILVTMLWESLAKDGLGDDVETIALARQRAKELDTGQVIGISHEEVMASLEKVLNEANLPS